MEVLTVFDGVAGRSTDRQGFSCALPVCTSSTLDVVLVAVEQRQLHT